MKSSLQRVVFEVTRNCNLQCKFCYNPWKASDDIPEVEEGYKKAKKTLKRIFKTTAPQQISFTGGEPLLAERLQELVLYTRMKGAAVNIISNGTLADRESLQRFKDIGVDRIQFSIHGDRPQEHDLLTGIPGSWKKVYRAFTSAKECGLRTSAVLVLTAINYPRLEQTLNMLAGLDIDSMLLNRFNVGGSGITHREKLAMDMESIREAFRIADAFVKREGLPIHSGVCTPVCLVDPKEYPAVSFGHCSPSIKKTPLTLDLEGNLRACNHSPTIIGNIFQSSIQEMEESFYLEQWATSRPDFCTDCTDFTRCFAGCRAAAEQLGRGLDVDPVLAAANI